MAIFVDTGAWFAYFERRDPDHPAAVEWMRQNRQPLVTTDFVFDELVTLLAGQGMELYRLHQQSRDCAVGDHRGLRVRSSF